MDFKNKVGWVLFFIALAMNMGAFILTTIALGTKKFQEANGILANLFNIHPIFVFVILLFGYVIMTWCYKRMLKRSLNYRPIMRNITIFIVPIIMCVLFGIDFFHDLLLLYFNINIVPWFEGILVFNQFFA